MHAVCRATCGTALQFAEMMPAESATALAAIRDRLYNCGAGGMPVQPVNPTAPFEPVDVQPEPGLEASEAASTAAAAQQPAAVTSNQGLTLTGITLPCQIV